MTVIYCSGDLAAALQDDGEEEEEEEGCPSEFTADCAAAALPLPHVHAQLLWSSRRRPDGLSLPLRGPLQLGSGGGPLPKCPVCFRSRARFHCGECVTSGDFVHSHTTPAYERYSDMRLRLCALRRNIAEAKAAIAKKTADAVRSGQLRDQLRQVRTKIKFLRHLVRTRRERNGQSAARLNKLDISNKKREERLPEYVNKVEKIRSCVEKFTSNMSVNRDQLVETRRELRHLRSDFVSSLSEIFPVEEVFPTNPDQSDAMLDCLAEAMKTSYIHGRWVTVDKSGEMQYRIVAPLLSSSGDYTPVYALIATSKEGAAGVEPKPAFNIAAGLTLTTQLLTLIAFITSVPLPARLSYADFGVFDTSEYRFARKVAKLNLNIVTLCLASGVEPARIRPCQTLHNVSLLVKHILDHRDVSMTYTGVYDKEPMDEIGDSYHYDYAFVSSVDLTASQVEEWEAAILREAEQLRQQQDQLQQQETDSEDETDSQQEQEWESVLDMEFPEAAEGLSSSPTDRNMERPPSSSLSFVSSTVSSLLWGISYSPKSPRK